MDNLQKIIDGLKQPIEPPKEDPSNKLSRDAAGQFILDVHQSKRILHPPFSTTHNARLKKKQEEPTKEQKDPTD